jgi:hypothetical protein
MWIRSKKTGTTGMREKGINNMELLNTGQWRRKTNL